MDAPTPRIELRPTKSLRHNPENERIYGLWEPDPDLIESVARGILDPLKITRTSVILSGHRRHMAALQADLKELPCVVVDVDETDRAAVLRIILDSNLHRRKTEEQIGREMLARMEVEKIEAEKRKIEAARRAGEASGAARRGETNVVAALPPRSEPEAEGFGKSRDLVGKIFGKGGRTVGQQVRVVNEIDRLRKTLPDKADIAREILNRKGVLPALKFLFPDEFKTKPDHQKPPKPTPAEEAPDTGGSDPVERGGSAATTFAAKTAAGPVGIANADDAIACLKRTPKNDPERAAGFEKVGNWIDGNLGIPQVAVAKDALGRPLPDSVRDAFGDPDLREQLADHDALTEILRRMHKRRQRLGKKLPAYPFFLYGAYLEHMDEIEAAAPAAREAVANALPYAVCPKCDGAGCGDCRKAGYLPEWAYRELTEGVARVNTDAA